MKSLLRFEDDGTYLKVTYECVHCKKQKYVWEKL